VGSRSVFSIIHHDSFYGKYNKLPMDEDAIRRELEHSGDVEDSEEETGVERTETCDKK
jgi:hypothetical protein